MILRSISWLFAGWLLLAPNMAVAQSVIDVELGQTLAQKAGSKSDLYRFVGVAGTKVTATLSAPGDIGLVIYTPDGEEMVSVQGKTNVILEVFLPIPDVYFVSVLRTDGSKPYTIKLDGVPPDDHLAFFSAGVGYEYTAPVNGTPEKMTKCWLDPGVKIKADVKGFGREVTLGRSGMETSVWKHPDGGVVFTEDRVSFDATKRTRVSMNGNPTITKDIEYYVRSDFGAYRGYLCN